MKMRAVIIFALALLIGLTGYQHQADQPIPSRFIKVSADGRALTAWQGPWSCVYDQQTGLLWENKTDDEAIHDGMWSYSWWQENHGVENSGDCRYEKNRCDTADLIRHTNQQGLCGHHDWRLPTARELTSLINPTPKTGQATINNDFFSHTKRGDFWTSDAHQPLTGVYQHLGQGALAIDFIAGKTTPLPYRNAAYVRLVRSGATVPKTTP